ncbi:MAG: hypothetical protein MUE54_10720 [Anaerolineae bacterium]|jgi:hypothetical protein|nr:hypothetical protein [Anaerolineae bacterium]
MLGVETVQNFLTPEIGVEKRIVADNGAYIYYCLGRVVLVKGASAPTWMDLTAEKIANDVNARYPNWHWHIETKKIEVEHFTIPSIETVKSPSVYGNLARKAIDLLVRFFGGHSVPLQNDEQRYWAYHFLRQYRDTTASAFDAWCLHAEVDLDDMLPPSDDEQLLFATVGDMRHYGNALVCAKALIASVTKSWAMELPSNPNEEEDEEDDKYFGASTLAKLRESKLFENED